MGVRFVIGRAGTGKSVRCAEEIRAAARRDPLGGSLFWITPEQGTFTAERMLLTAGAGSRGEGTFRAQALSFRRLAASVGREVGFLQGDHVKPMDDVARVVLLEDVVRAEKEKLQIFAGVAERPGFVQKLDVTLRELRQHGHTGESLREMISAEADGVTGRKLHDLALLLDAWGAVMDRRDAWDFEKIMHHAALRMGESRVICGLGEWGAGGDLGGWVFGDVGAGAADAGGGGGTRGRGDGDVACGSGCGSESGFAVCAGGLGGDGAVCADGAVVLPHDGSVSEAPRRRERRRNICGRGIGFGRRGCGASAGGRAV